MSTADLTLVLAARDWRSGWQARWREASPRTRTRVQVAVLLAVVVVAYHYSLATLVKTLNLDTPLAYIGLVPLIALGMAAVRSRPAQREPAIHDRQVDYIVGLPLIVTALALNFFLPNQLSAMFWVWRIDLLSLPFFVAGVGSILFGIRAIWRQRLALAYLFLVWPLPYSLVLLKVLGSFTNLTLRALHPLVGVLNVASAVPGGDGSIFQVVHNGRAFPLSVVSACSGVNGMVGFLLVGIAFGAVVTGPRLRKTLWLAFGLLLLWAINLARLLFIFWTGRQYGEHFAIQILHPFIGLVSFDIGIVIMILLLKPAGLRIGRIGERGVATVSSPAVSSPARPVAVPKVYSAIALVVVAGALLGVNNGGLRTYDLVANAAGEPKLASYLSYPASPAGWQKAVFGYEFTFARPFFGESSKWYRWNYIAADTGSPDLYSSTPVTADVINTSDLSSFSAYGVEACYRFHGYSLRDVAQVNLGGGIVGQALSYSTNKRQDWTLVYWVWPVHERGFKTRYERVILYMQDTTTATVRAPGAVSGIKGLKGALSGRDATERRLLNNRAFLVAFAREVIKAQATVPVGSSLPHRLPRPDPAPTATTIPSSAAPVRPETTPTVVSPIR